MSGDRGGTKLQFTPTWSISLICSIIVLISLIVERRLHTLGKFFKRKNQKTLYEALLKVKEELMLLGFISLFLTVFQDTLHEICVPNEWNHHFLPCQLDKEKAEEALEAVAHIAIGALTGRSGRSLMEEAAGGHDRGEEEHGSGHGPPPTHEVPRGCKPGKAPLISFEALHQLHIFIFVLAITHCLFTLFTAILGGLKIKKWKPWEESYRNETKSATGSVFLMQRATFVKDHFKGIRKQSRLLQLLNTFGKQFHDSVSRSDYAAIRLGFIMTHCKTNPQFDFHKYMVRALEADFKKVIGISWYLWVFGIIFLFLNVDGWHAYFWMSFIPLILLLVVGWKLELVITQLAIDVAERQSGLNGDEVVKPSDDYFWFGRPRLMLYLIHFILFQNAFEIAYFFWILATYGSHSCIMDKMYFVVPRLAIGVIIQIVCSYSTLPLYAIVTQMGSSFKRAIFKDYVQEGLIGWAKDARRKSQRAASLSRSESESAIEEKPMDIQVLQVLSSSRRIDSLKDVFR